MELSNFKQTQDFLLKTEEVFEDVDFKHKTESILPNYCTTILPSPKQCLLSP